MQIKKLTNTFGAEIIDVNIPDLTDRGDLDSIMEAFLAYQVIVIRNQKLSPVEQKKFSEEFGDLDIHISSKNKHKDHPELLILSNKKFNGEWVGATNAGDEWHTDTQYMPIPSKCTMLHALEVPEEGGETAFINTYAAFEALPASTQNKIRNLKGVNSWNRLKNPRVKIPKQHGDGKSVYDIGHPDVMHPIVRSHPETGRLALYVSPRHTLFVKGMPAKESEELLQELFSVQQNPEIIYTHKWKLGDVLIWDNRCTLHKGMGDIKAPGIRHLHRTLMAGSVPG
ncbi:MAG: taurine catabolism dioxygenase TauD [Rhodospirillales bacterium]|nr:taurine catabolism dioxygenase TauD [Rhodospirillales bacterium]